MSSPWFGVFDEGWKTDRWNEFQGNINIIAFSRHLFSGSCTKNAKEGEKMDDGFKAPCLSLSILCSSPELAKHLEQSVSIILIYLLDKATATKCSLEKYLLNFISKIQFCWQSKFYKDCLITNYCNIIIETVSCLEVFAAFCWKK